MNIFIVNPKEKIVKPHEFDGQMTSIYSFFNSILVDHSLILKDHIIYTNADYANDADTTPFFIAEQLFLGQALVLGVNGEEEIDANIQKEELHDIIHYDINDFYSQVLEVLIKNEINIYKTFRIKNQDEMMDVDYEWVLYTFNMADEKTQKYFLDELQKHTKSPQDIVQYFQKMAQLAINAAAYQ